MTGGYGTLTAKRPNNSMHNRVRAVAASPTNRLRREDITATFRCDEDRGYTIIFSEAIFADLGHIVIVSYAAHRGWPSRLQRHARQSEQLLNYKTCLQIIFNSSAAAEDVYKPPA